MPKILWQHSDTAKRAPAVLFKICVPKGEIVKLFFCGTYRI
jgi:hypothetical protein